MTSDTFTRLVRSAVAPLHDGAAAGSQQVSQVLAGHAVAILESRMPWHRVRAVDGYEGWIHEGYLAPAGPASSSSELLRTSLGCVVRDRDGTRRALPLGARVPDDATVEEGRALGPTELHAECPRNPRSICAHALAWFEGAPYEWGGVTPWGADCSGFTQSVLTLHGFAMPRDSRQQAACGVAVAGGLDALEPADLLFFSDRADGGITHVALALGGDRIVHLALGRGGYAVEHLSAREDRYVAALLGRHRFSRRLF